MDNNVQCFLVSENVDLIKKNTKNTHAEKSHSESCWKQIY